LLNRSAALPRKLGPRLAITIRVAAVEVPRHHDEAQAAEAVLAELDEAGLDQVDGHPVVHRAREVVCGTGQAHPDKQHVLVGILAAFVQPEHDGDRDVGGRPPGAAFLPPGEIIDVRLEDFQDPVRRHLVLVIAALAVCAVTAAWPRRPMASLAPLPPGTIPLVQQTRTPGAQLRPGQLAIGDCRTRKKNEKEKAAQSSAERQFGYPIRIF
jgi:hypothetical protein